MKLGKEAIMKKVLKFDIELRYEHLKQIHKEKLASLDGKGAIPLFIYGHVPLVNHYI